METLISHIKLHFEEDWPPNRREKAVIYKTWVEMLILFHKVVE